MASFVDRTRRKSLETVPLSSFISARNELFDQLWDRHVHTLAAKRREHIKVDLLIGGESTFPEARSWESTPGHLLKYLPKDAAADVVVARVNGVLWDLDRVLESDCKVEFVSSRDPEGRSVFWHSSAHVLGEAAEHEYECLLSHGPPTSMGFFYDMALDGGRAVSQSDWPSIEARVKAFIKDKQSFQRLEVSKEDLRTMFAYSKFKLHYIEKFVPEGGSSTVYRNGTLVDLCQGPHIQHTKKIETFKIMRTGSAYFLGDQKNDSLQRIHGVAFPTKDQMREWDAFLDDAKRRDHQLIGREQKLWWFHKFSPGSPFYLPHGQRIWNAIQTLLREEYWDRGYHEVQSPTMYDVELWKTSGHWQHYQDDMFRLQLKDSSNQQLESNIRGDDGHTQNIEDKDQGLFALKPMNCPGHALMFAAEERSYRDLPLRYADFSVLHRNEASGALSGMTRVRRFKQDDGHIFCTLAQVSDEITGIIDFMTKIYSLFGFSFKLKLSTRPEAYMGKLEEWDDAEERLKDVLTAFVGDDWTLNEGDGAFYGPKIDVTITDAMNREWQCATIQLDFQISQNFKLVYRTAEQPLDSRSGTTAETGESLGKGLARPVVLHRAIVGSFDRFLAITCEHFAGKWPFWLSPRQIMIIPVIKDAENYAEEVQKIFHKAKMFVDVDFSSNTLQKKVRAAQLAQYNFVFVLGAQEVENRALNIRNRDDPKTQSKGALMPLNDVLKRLKVLKEERALLNTI